MYSSSPSSSYRLCFSSTPSPPPPPHPPPVYPFVSPSHYPYPYYYPSTSLAPVHPSYQYDHSYP
eukprot:15478824-Alexandrium_andersonii.AAC.2